MGKTALFLGVLTCLTTVTTQIVDRNEYSHSEGNCMMATTTVTAMDEDRAPCFVGGEDAMRSFFAQNANPRKPAIASAGYGEVIVEFIVTTDGGIVDAKWRGRVLESLDREALRLVNMMPKWEPGMRNGRPVRMKVQVGLRFYPEQEFRFIKAMY